MVIHTGVKCCSNHTQDIRQKKTLLYCKATEDPGTGQGLRLHQGSEILSPGHLGGRKGGYPTPDGPARPGLGGVLFCLAFAAALFLR